MAQIEPLTQEEIEFIRGSLIEDSIEHGGRWTDKHNNLYGSIMRKLEGKTDY